jgi:hypothetical protein
MTNSLPLACSKTEGTILFGLMSSTTKVVHSPELNRKRASLVLSQIDSILAREAIQEADREAMYVELGQCLCEVRAGQYWRLENLKSFDEFVAKRFPGSRRKAYYFMAICEQLPKPARSQLRGIGWSKAIELNRVARKDRDAFDSATWLHKARSMPKDEFKQEVERHLNGPTAEPHEMLYFKVYKSQLPVIEQALETVASMLGSDRSRGYCLEMICADFLAGVQGGPNGNCEIAFEAVLRVVQLLPGDQQKRLRAAMELR